MDDVFEPTYFTITDEDGQEFEMEILDEVEMDGKLYYAMVQADATDEETEEVIILRVEQEDGEDVLVTPDDDDEAERAFQLFMDRLYQDEEAEEE